jgi:hypothetical protein
MIPSSKAWKTASVLGAGSASRMQKSPPHFIWKPERSKRRRLAAIPVYGAILVALAGGLVPTKKLEGPVAEPQTPSSAPRAGFTEPARKAMMAKIAILNRGAGGKSVTGPTINTATPPIEAEDHRLAARDYISLRTQMLEGP